MPPSRAKTDVYDAEDGSDGGFDEVRRSAGVYEDIHRAMFQA